MATHTLEPHEAASAFAALGSEQRLAIVTTLVRAGPEGLSMGELGDRTTITGSTLTHHLRILTAANLVEQHKQGRTVMCSAVEFERVELLSRYLLQACCADVADDAGQSHQEHSHD